MTPVRDVSCLDSPARLMMNSTAATMYAAWAAEAAVTGRSALREHAEHPAGHGEAAEDVDAGQQDRRERQHGDHGVMVPDLQEGADHDDARYGVGHRHQRRVERVMHVT